MASWMMTTGLLIMYLVLALRAPFVWHHRLQRILWIAVALQAINTTLYLPSVIRTLGSVFNSTNTIDLLRHSLMVGSYIAMGLLFLAAAGPHVLRIWRTPFLVVVTAVVITLTIIVITSPPHARVVSLAPEIPLLYWLVYLGFALAADLSLVIVSAFLFKKASSAETRWMIGFFGLSVVFSVALWSVFLTANITQRSAVLVCVEPITGIQQTLLSASLVIPGAVAVLRYTRRYRQLHALQPLWRTLTTTVPATVLDPSAHSNQPIWLSNNILELTLYRTIIEIYDAVMKLAPYADDQLRDHARHFVTNHSIATQNLTPTQHEPAITACWIAAACRAHNNNQSPRDAATVITNHITLPDDITFLTTVATFSHTELPTAFLHYLDTTTTSISTPQL